MILPGFSYVLEQASDITLREKKLDYVCNHKSEIINFCNAVEGHSLEAMKIVHHHTNDRFNWIISEHQSVNPSREVISILSGDTEDLRLSILCATDSKLLKMVSLKCYLKF